MRIAFIGTGLMGAPMIRNLIRAGHSLVIYNRTRTRAEKLIPDGVEVVDSPAQAAKGAEVVITCISDTPDVEQVLLGPNGVIETARPGTVVIDMSTISPKETRRMAETLSARGITMLDAPVSGGEIGAIAGTLSIMVGGDVTAFDRMMPVFEAMGKTILHCGESGMGQTIKLCNQIAISTHLIAAAEAVAFARRTGADPHLMAKAVGAGAAGSWIINNVADKMADGDFAPGFMVKLMQKDLRLVMETANEIGLPLPGAELAFQLFEEVERQGGGDLGTQSIIQVVDPPV